MRPSEPAAISPNAYATLPVSVLGEPVKAVRQSSLKNGGSPKPCDARVLIQPVVDAKKGLIGFYTVDFGTKTPPQSEALKLFPITTPGPNDLPGENLPDDPLGAHHTEKVQKPREGADVLGRWTTDFPSLTPLATVGDAQAAFQQGDWEYLPLVDVQGRYTGHCASRRRLEDLLSGQARPVRIGGLATPLGVYMTSGAYISGSGWPGLIATGLLFGVVAHLLDAWILVAYSALAALFPSIIHWREGQQLILESGLMLCSLLGLLRLSPMSGLHAAEHMTINAIENDLPVTLPVVRQQPRAHPRCGTNLMVLLGGAQLVGLFLYTTGHAMNPLGQLLYALGGGVLVFKGWQPAGLWLQRHFTTKTPTDAQVESGMKAGLELLEKYRANPHPYPGVWPRLWRSGMIPMALSFAASAGLIQLLLDWLGSGALNRISP